MKVLAINGSPRRGGNTAAMIDAATDELRAAGIEVEVVSLADHDVKPCTGCERCAKQPWDCPIEDDALPLLRKMVEADGVLMGSPVYCGGVTAQLKALMDRSIVPYQAGELKGKVAGAIAVGGGKHGGQEMTISQLYTYFLMMDMIIAPAEGGYYGAMGTGDGKGEVRQDEDGIASARALGRRMAQLLGRHGP
ncbi:MAG: flavodoxin family protein [Thermoplasmata archaeon]